MPRGLNDTSQLVSAEGQALILDFQRTSDTTGLLSWTIPKNNRTYDGILITGAIKQINPSNFPTDTVRYIASSDLAAPADSIGNAKVVVALYGDQTTVQMAVTGLIANVTYYFSAHLVTSINTYWTVGVRSYPQDESTPAFAGDINRQYEPPANPTPGQVYFDVMQQLLFFWDDVDATWKPTSTDTVITSDVEPVTPFLGLPEGYPKLGDFYYNTRTKMLRSWNGTIWQDAQSLTGVPSYAKADVGTNLAYTARANLIDVLKKQLGYPVVCVELVEDHYNIAIDNALMELRHRTDTAYYKQYFFMTMHPKQTTYYLNDPVSETNKIVDVVKIHRINNFGLGNFAPNNIFAQQFLNQFYAPGVGYDMISIHLMSSMSELYTQIFAGEIAFNWRESRRELSLYRSMAANEKVLVESTCEKLEQELLLDRWTQQWIQQWAESELMLILAHIRGKFATLPGPGGSLSLNADVLLSEGQRLQEDCLRQIRELEVGQNGPDNYFTPFVIG